MHVKQRNRTFSFSLFIALSVAGSLAYSSALPSGGALFSTSILTNRLPELQLNQLLLLAFFCGIAVSLLLIVRPMRAAQKKREAQLQEDMLQLEALNRELHRQACYDGLLGIANRREFQRVLDKEWRRADRERQPVSLLLIDVDHFKVYNDTYGHLTGDACLQAIATVLQQAIRRPGDLAARYGGEELAIVLPGTNLEGASRIAQQVHDLLAKRAIPFAASPVAEHVTVSIGVASMLPARQLSSSMLIEQADQGLYAAKDNGRSRTEAVPHLRLIASQDEPAESNTVQRAY